MKSTNRVVAAVMMTLALSGCAGVPNKMATSLPIEIDTGFGTPRYLQDGKAIDGADMVEQLSKEPDAAHFVTRAKGLNAAATLFAVVGGALIGIPLGQKLGGNKDPLWALAGAGGACVALTIPLTIGSVSSMDSAVEVHNHDGHGSDSAPKSDASSGPVRHDAPGIAAGIALDRSLDAARARTDSTASLVGR
jgi:hypothetical protein